MHFTLVCTEGKKLVLRPRLFVVATGPEVVRDVGDEDVLDVLEALGGAKQKGCEVLRLGGLLMRIPSSGATHDSVEDLTIEALQGLQGLQALEVEARRCVEVLRHFSMGVLKSCLQKTIRFHAKKVDIYGERISVEVVAAVSTGLLFALKGGFSPELQLFSKGSTAALKRLGVILVEDAWDSAAALAALFGLASVSCGDYAVPREVTVLVMRLAAKAAGSSTVISRKTGSESRSESRSESTLKLSAREVTFIEAAAKLLRSLRSFPTDLEMLDELAGDAASNLEVKLQSDRLSRPCVMPLCHIVDQHSFRGIGHVLPKDFAASFKERFRLLFECTGSNPRRAQLKDETPRLRAAQSFCLKKLFKKKKREREESSEELKESLEVALELDPGVLAAAVGPIQVKGTQPKRELLVLLGLQCPEDEVVMQKPVRQVRDLLISGDERNLAVQSARSRRHALSSPLLRKKEASFHDGMWHVDGESWRELVKKGLKITVHLEEAPSWLQNSEMSDNFLDDDRALEEALDFIGLGMLRDAEELVKRIMRQCSRSISLRALSLIRQQYEKVSMPTPSLHGGIASDQMAAYEGDWLVYRLLVLLYRLVPGALRPSMPPNFKVVNVILLRLLEKWMQETSLQFVSEVSSLREKTWRAELGEALERIEPQLMEHQREAIRSSFPYFFMADIS